MRREVLKELKSKRNAYAKLFSLGCTEDSQDHLISFLPNQQDFESEISSIMMRRIQDTIGKLSDRKKEVILLKFYENLTYAEISEVMELRDPKYARQLVYRSLDELRKNLILTHDVSIPICTVYAILFMIFLPEII
jgi:RNA polymerase sigma factor (sigma-70 family)